MVPPVWRRLTSFGRPRWHSMSRRRTSASRSPTRCSASGLPPSRPRYEPFAPLFPPSAAERSAELRGCAQAVEAENEATGRIATSKATLQVTQAEAYEEGESRERESRARVEELEAKAFAEAAKAQAERIEMDKRAELEAPAKAMKSKIITDAEADAEATIINARGKADATFIQVRPNLVCL